MLTRPITRGITRPITRPLVRQSSAFDPLTLWAQGQQGAFYAPWDLNTLFQDSAGTTPVTADGDPVGLMLDKSGNGNHASQSTTAAKPTYRTDGTLHWLEFDGVDDYMSSQLPGNLNEDFFLSFSCSVSGSLSSTHSVSGIQNSNSATPGLILYGRRGLSGTVDQAGSLVANETQTGNTTLNISALRRAVAVKSDSGNKRALAYKDLEGNPIATPVLSGSNLFAIGAALDSTPLYFPGTFYGWVLVLGSVEDAASKKSLEYLAAKAGVPLP